MSAKIATPLSRKAVLVAVNISQWSARKLDRKITDKVNREHGAAKDAGRYNKLLIDADHLTEMQSLVSKARALHYTMTRPWTDEGPRILPNALFAKFSNEFRTLKREFNDAADRFAAAYPSFVEQRRHALNGLFSEADYPSADQIRSKFNLDLTMLPFPDAEDFRSELDADTVAEIKRELAETSAKAVDGAMAHTANQIIETVGHMAEKLAAYKSGSKGEKAEGVFRDSLVGNVRQLADLLPAFNLTNDPRLTAVTDRIVRELCAEDPETLRQNDQARASVAKSADDIVAEVSTLFG
jgi:hypothetical protein